MSRRVPPNAAAERAAQNQQTIKTLLKLEGNKTCADCKRNKHPRWASWNLGIFVCIRCSGIHRGMGTHISRVKSVDLDAWTDEQLQSVLRWGNARANKYWEAKLAPGHVPSEAKIENFIRTKYESKRWTMEGPIPDPATLDDEGDDDIPLNVVQEKAKLERSVSQQKQSPLSQPKPPVQRAVPSADIFGEIPSPPARPSTTGTSAVRATPPQASAPLKQSKPADSLLGLDFFGGSPSAPLGASVSPTPTNSAVSSRPDLKQSILSLYASAPRPQAQPQHERQTSFGGMQSPPVQASSAQQQSNFGGVDDAFSSLSFTSTASAPVAKPQQLPKTSSFAAFDKPSNQRSSVAPPHLTSPSIGGGGGFFDTSPKPALKPAATPKSSAQYHLVQENNNTALSFGDLDFSSPKAAIQSKPSTESHGSDMFDFSEPPIKPSTSNNKPSVPPSVISSPFNLSAPAASSQIVPKPAPAASNAFPSFSAADAWGSNDAWATPDPISTNASAQPKNAKSSAGLTTSSDLAWGGISSSSASGFGGGSVQAPPKIIADEDFGGWNSAVLATPTSVVAAKPNGPSNPKPAGSGFGASEDLFSNVWE